jgi:hypothetical protein
VPDEVPHNECRLKERVVYRWNGTFFRLKISNSLFSSEEGDKTELGRGDLIE